MKESVRLAAGIGMGLVIYFVGLYVVPGFGPLRALTSKTIISSGEITQAVYLVVSMTLMLILTRGRLGRYGFRWPALKPTLLAILTAAVLQVLLLVVMMVSVSMFGPPMMTGRLVGQMGTSVPRTILAVWLIASTCEELFYRGLLYGFMEPLKSRGVSVGGLYISLPVAVCALMFGLGHLCVMSFMPGVVVANIVLATTVCGFVAGYIRERTGSILPAILVHMTFNAVGSSIPWLMRG